jgi:putative hydrolase of the HAD superfamily
MPAVIFDLDDTLYPHVQFVYSGFGAVARYIEREHGRPADAIYATLRLARDVGYQGQEFQRLCLLHGLDVALLPDLVRVYRLHTPQLFLAHDAAATLGRLRAAGWRTAVLTNGVPAVQAGKVRALGLEPLVDHVLYANEYADGGKPAPEPFRAALDRLLVSPRDAVMVGDDPRNDIEGGRAAGLRTIAVARPWHPHCDAADAVVRLLTEVPRVASDLLEREANRAA